MIPIIPSLLILYYTGKTFSMIYFTGNLILALYLYNTACKYYFPDMRNKKNQYFHENYKAFERQELFLISILKIYHGLLNYFWFKTIFSIFFLFTIWLSLFITFWGAKDDYVFTKEDRKRIVAFNSVLAKLVYLSHGVIIHEIDLTKDEKTLAIFRKYLGPDYQPQEKFSSVIANHSSWNDITYLEKKFSPSFIAKASVRSVPIVGLIAWTQKSCFISRRDNDDVEKTKEFINSKQKDVFEGKDYFPMCIFPEGTSTNGKYIGNFKGGAFYSLFPTKSVLFNQKPYKTSFPIGTSAMDIPLHMALSFTFFYNEIDAFELPVFAPTDYLYKHFSHLGDSKYHIYKEAVRLVWSEIIQCPLNSGGLDMKLEYKSKIKGKLIKDT